METLFDSKHLYRSYFQLAFPMVLGLVVTLVCVRLFGYNGVLMGQAAADVCSAFLALALLAGSGKRA